MKYLNRSFTVGGSGSDSYAKNWDRIFNRGDLMQCDECGSEVFAHDIVGHKGHYCEECWPKTADYEDCNENCPHDYVDNTASE